MRFVGNASSPARYMHREAADVTHAWELCGINYQRTQHHGGPHDYARRDVLQQLLVPHLKCTTRDRGHSMENFRSMGHNAFVHHACCMDLESTFCAAVVGHLVAARGG